MKTKNLITIALLLAFCHIRAQNLQISKLTGDFYVYTTYNDYKGKPFPSNGLYLVTDQGVVIIDTPWDKSKFQPLLDSIEKKHHKKAILCIATHYHDDRTAGLAYFKSKGIKTYSSELTKKLCREHQEKEAEFTFKSDTVFTVGGYKIEAFYPGEGHTRDNIVVWFEKDRLLYGGCFVKSTETASLGNIADANLDAWGESLQKLYKKYPKPTYVIPGHLGWTSNKAVVHTVKLLRQHYKETHPEPERTRHQE